MTENQPPKYRWYILALLTAVGTFVTAMPASCMPSLFAEIRGDLGLSDVQIGTIWGFASLAGIFVSLVAGVLGDRLGVKSIIGFACVLAGITGALRGVADSFLVLMAIVFINGFVRFILPINVTKAIGIWFKGDRLGLAMGIGAMGIGLGLMLGPMISATVLSPWLGGWRNVMYFYGAISVVVGLLWFIFGRELRSTSETSAISDAPLFREAFSKLLRNKALWLIAITLMFRTASVMGMTGYLPLYLRDRGWAPASADGALTAFYAISTLCVIPLSLLSDRLKSRRAILYPALITGLVCISLIPFVEANIVWLMVVMAGIFMDGFMAISVVMLLETEGIGPLYSGTALGIVFTIITIGSVVSPPVGNSLAGIGQGLPFVFWGSLSIVALITLALSTKMASRRVPGAVAETEAGR